MFGFLICLAFALACAFGLRVVKSAPLAIILVIGYASLFALTLMMTPLPSGGWWGFVVTIAGFIIGTALLIWIVDFKKLLVNVSGRIAAEQNK